MLTEQGYDPDKSFNALYGNKQLYFAHGDTGLAIDVLIVTFPLQDSDDPGAIDLRVFRSLVADDWGWWRTVTLNLERITKLLNAGARPAIEGGKLDPRTQLQALTDAAESTAKSRRWKMRARIGERKRWYDVPEETPHE